MAVIAPFKGILYNPEKIGDMSKVIAPPYDVISPDGQENLYQKSDYNIVRLDFAKGSPSDDESSNRYTRAASDFKKWQADGILVSDERPAIYIYEQDYRLKDGTVKTRKGFMSLVRIEELDSGVILPHETTLSGPKTDRLNLTKATDANFSPIFSLYSDPGLKTNSLLSGESKTLPIVNVQGEDGANNRLWRVTDESIINGLIREISDKMIFIADGHHRYETALNYRNEMREKHPDYTGKEGFNYTLMYFSNMDDEGLTVFPTHRLMYGVKEFDPDVLENRLSENFEIERMAVPVAADLWDPFMERLREKGRSGHSFGVYAKGWNHAAIITLRNEDIMGRFVAEHSKAYRRLDVTILHTLVIENILGVSKERQKKKENIEYIQDEGEGLSKIQNGERQLLFILNPTKVTEVEDVAKARDKMPQKSTYFYPKLLTGLVINKIGDTTI
ncbi:MAG: DUF1015 domain-containing protein [Deltaproteobacteria bacterium]